MGWVANFGYAGNDGVALSGRESVEVRERIGHKQKVVMEEGEEGNR